MDKSGKNGNSVKKGISFLLARSRCGIQFLATLLTNIHLPNFFKGKIYQGSGKTVCVPGLNCYSCPGAAGSCPIGALQAVVGSSKFRFSYYITGFLILLGVLLGRFICGFLCPFGWFQDLLHKIPGKKFSTKKLRPLRYIKYAVLLIMVLILPAVITNSAGMGNPFFLQISLSAGSSGRRDPAGTGGFRDSLRAGKPVCLEERGTDHCDCTQHSLLSSVLQMDLPAGRFLLVL